MNRLSGTGFVLVAVFVYCTVISASFCVAAEGDIKLPPPSLKSDVSIEQALSERRSLRTYKDVPVTIAEVSQLMWAAQGITDPERGYRTAPSGMAAFPLYVYSVAFNVTGIPQGAYRYDPAGHELILVTKGDLRNQFKRRPFSPDSSSGSKLPSPESQGTASPRDGGASGSPTPPGPGIMTDPVDTAALMIIITGNIKQTNEPSYYLEAGHVAQNIALQCVSLDMGVVTTRGFDEEALKRLLNLSEWEHPIYVLPAGKE